MSKEPSPSWLRCRKCGHQSTSVGGLHKHIRAKHDVDAWTYYQEHRDALQDRFKANVALVQTRDGMTPCWVYQGRQMRHGYCQMRIAGAPMHRAHRMVLFAFNGELPLPTDLVLHQCDNPPCCNPAHLRVGSHTENMEERAERNRTAVGTRVPHSALDVFGVQHARVLSTLGWSAARIARKLDVDNQVIERLLQGKTYRNVPHLETDPDFIPW